MLYDRRWDAEGFAYLHLDIRICKKCLIYLEICIILYFAFSTKDEHCFSDYCQIICKPGSVIEDVISLGLNSHLSSSG